MKHYVDGFLVGRNPARYGGFVVVNTDTSVFWLNQGNITNNDAEIQGLAYVLSICKNGDSISTDSVVAITWVNGGKSKSRPDLNEQLAKFKTVLIGKNVNLMWERRNFNKAGNYIEENHHILDTLPPDRTKINIPQKYFSTVQPYVLKNTLF
jgi:ribonuclease HI